MVGGTAERRYRQARPEVEAMPWGTLSVAGCSERGVLAARRAWTNAAFQEFRTGAACAATLRALIEARAPLDLTALAARFPLDELVHVELCARVATELGGAAELAYDPNSIIDDPPPGADALMRAAHLVLAYFCVGEALSIPLLHGTAKAASQPLLQAVLRRIVRDEADHGTFGWAFFDWAGPLLDHEDRVLLGQTADRFIGGIGRTWEALAQQEQVAESEAHALGWLGTGPYLALARRTLRQQVMAPLRGRGIPVSEPAFLGG